MQVLQLTVTFWVILAFLHVMADWLFQSHQTAERKKENPRIRFDHSFAYGMCIAIPFYSLLFLLIPPFCPYYLGTLCYLVLTHYIGDSYRLVHWWLRKIRKVPTCQLTEEWPLTVILAIVIDQFYHLLCLWPIAFITALQVTP